MKLSNETLNVLKNFASINQNLEFKQGNKLSTISASKTILVKAGLKDQFPEDFCVYDLNKFLSVHSLHKDVELDFNGPDIVFKSGRNKIKYRKAAKQSIVTPPDKDLKLPSVDVSFTLKEEDLASALKTANVLQSPHIAFESDGDSIISMSSFDAKDDSAHVNSIEIVNDDSKNFKKFKAVFLTENLKMISGSYEVEISSKGLASFKNNGDDIQYWIAIESKDSNLTF